MLPFAAIAAPILGVFAAALELRASSNLGATPVLGTTLGIVAFGLAVSLLALLFTRLLGLSLAEDCTSLLMPVVEAARCLSGRGRGRSTEDSDDEAALEKRVRAWTSPPWSRELDRLRTAAGLISWLLTAALIALVSHPGGLADQWLGG